MISDKFSQKILCRLFECVLARSPSAPKLHTKRASGRMSHDEEQGRKAGKRRARWPEAAAAHALGILRSRVPFRGQRGAHKHRAVRESPASSGAPVPRLACSSHSQFVHSFCRPCSHHLGRRSRCRLQVSTSFSLDSFFGLPAFPPEPALLAAHQMEFFPQFVVVVIESTVVSKRLSSAE